MKTKIVQAAKLEMPTRVAVRKQSGSDNVCNSGGLEANRQKPPLQRQESIIMKRSIAKFPPTAIVTSDQRKIKVEPISTDKQLVPESHSTLLLVSWLLFFFVRCHKQKLILILFLTATRCKY